MELRRNRGEEEKERRREEEEEEEGEEEEGRRGSQIKVWNYDYYHEYMSRVVWNNLG